MSPLNHLFGPHSEWEGDGRWQWRELCYEEDGRSWCVRELSMDNEEPILYFESDEIGGERYYPLIPLMCAALNASADLGNGEPK